METVLGLMLIVSGILNMVFGGLLYRESQRNLSHIGNDAVKVCIKLYEYCWPKGCWIGTDNVQGKDILNIAQGTKEIVRRVRDA